MLLCLCLTYFDLVFIVLHLCQNNDCPQINVQILLVQNWKLNKKSSSEEHNSFQPSEHDTWLENELSLGPKQLSLVNDVQVDQITLR